MGKYSWYGIRPSTIAIGTRVARDNSPRVIGIIMGVDPEATSINYYTKLRVLWLVGKNKGKVHLVENHSLFNFTQYKNDYEADYLRVTTASDEAEEFLKTLPNLQHLQGVENGEEE